MNSGLIFLISSRWRRLRRGRKLRFEVTADMSEGEIGEMLIENGLIDEDLLVFRAQVLFSGYHGELLPGTYILNTSQTVDEMLEILSRNNTEGQPQQEAAQE